MDLSSVLLLDDDGTPIIPEGGSDTPGSGIYSITVQSYNGSFIKCNTITVDRGPNSTYPLPDGYRLMTTATSVSTGGVHIVETYVPQMLLDVDIQILMLDDTGINPSAGAASGVTHKSLTPGQRKGIYEGLNDPHSTFTALMSVAGSGLARVGSNIGSTKCLKQMSFAFEVTGIQEIDGMLAKRVTPSSFMQIVYAGFGIVLIQTGVNDWVLTDMITASGSSEPKQVSIENIASLRSSYDYKKMAKSTHIGLNGEGQIVATPNSSVSGGIAAESYKDGQLNQRTAYAGSSIATGIDIELSAQAMPLLRFISYKNVTVKEGAEGKDAEATYKLEGDCFPEGEITAKAVPIELKEGSLIYAPPVSDKKKFDISALAVEAKGKFAMFIHKLLIFRNKLESAQLSTTFDGVVLPAFTSFEVTGGEGSLQKVIISPTDAERVVETANVETQGYIMSSTIIRSSGRIISVVSYINMEDAFPLVFK